MYFLGMSNYFLIHIKNQLPTGERQDGWCTYVLELLNFLRIFGTVYEPLRTPLNIYAYLRITRYYH